MKRRTWQPLFTTYHMGYLHQVVINDISQMIGWQLISALIQHLVIKYISLNAHLATYHVVNEDFLAAFYLETNDILLTILD